MVRLILLLLTAGILAGLLLQNLSPIALIVLGAQTPALPLGVWVTAAIGAGALTALVLSGLLSLARPRRATAPRSSTFAGSRANWFSNANNANPANPSPFSRNTSRAAGTTGSAQRSEDDWESAGQSKDDWEDWGGYEETDRPAGASANRRTEVRDREDEPWANWDGYEEERRRDDRSSIPVDQPPEDQLPRRTDFEVKQEPVIRQQSGTVYSYGYRQPDPSGAGRSENVYDAEYRVITPPYRTEPEAAPPVQPSTDSEDEDWGLDDDDWREDNDRKNKP